MMILLRRMEAVPDREEEDETDKGQGQGDLPADSWPDGDVIWGRLRAVQLVSSF